MPRTLRTKAFFENLPHLLSAPLEENAQKLIVLCPDCDTLVQRQWVRLARRLYPRHTTAYQRVEDHIRTLGLDVFKPIEIGSLRVRSMADFPDDVQREWYFSARATEYFASWTHDYHIDNLSFEIEDHTGSPLLAVPCSIFHAGALTFFHQPIVPLVREGLRSADQATLDRVIRAALSHLETLSEEFAAYSFLVAAEGPDVGYTLLHAAKGRNVVHNLRLQPMVDLTVPPEHLFRSLRTSYRKLIRKFKHDRHIQALTGSDVASDRAKLKSAIAELDTGHEAPSDAEINMCLDACIDGSGEALLVYKDDETLQAALIALDDGDSTLCAIGAFGAESDGVPVSHAMLLEAMLRAQLRGSRRFFLSHIPDPLYDFDGLRLIDNTTREGYKFFKLGFANRVQRWDTIRFLPTERQPSLGDEPANAMTVIYDSPTTRAVELKEADGSLRRLMTIGPGFLPWQGGFDVARPYWHIFQFSKHLTYAAACVPGPLQRCAVLGLGAGIVPHALRPLFPAASIDVVEIEEEVIAVCASHFFDLASLEINVVQADANEFLSRPGDPYDFIACDISGGEGSIPPFLSAPDFYAQVKHRLSGHGVLAINVQRPHYLTIAEQLLLQFRFVASFAGNNATFIASDTAFAEPPSGIRSKLSATNIETEAIAGGMVSLTPWRARHADPPAEQDRTAQILLQEILDSRSWRITAPLRHAGIALRRSRKPKA